MRITQLDPAVSLSVTVPTSACARTRAHDLARLMSPTASPGAPSTCTASPPAALHTGAAKRLSDQFYFKVINQCQNRRCVAVINCCQGALL